MKFIFSFLSISICLLTSRPVLATPDSLAVSNLILKISPQHLLVNSLYLEMEKRLHAGSRHSIIFSPRYYYGGADYVNSLNGRVNELDTRTKVNGYGAGLQHRIYLIEEIPDIPQGVYVAYGIDYRDLQVDFIREGYGKETDENGLEYYSYRLRTFREKIKRYGGVIMGGLQLPLIHDKVLADLSLGLGYRISSIETNYSESFFNEGPTDFGYTGSYVLMNLKFGYAF